MLNTTHLKFGKGYVAPVLTDDGTSPSPTGFKGYYTLTASKTYVYPLRGAGSQYISAHLQWDSALILTSITVEDCDMFEDDVSDYSLTAGDWIDEDPSTAFVGSVGTGVSVTNGVVSLSGGAAGGCMIHIADTGARRTRLKVVVGGTGGQLRVATHSKG